MYNKEACISKTIFSVLNQDYENFEVIVVDDGSTDNSSDIVRSIQDSRLHYFSKNNGGVSSARNFGVKKSSADWIVFLDADDMLCKHALKHFDKLITQNKQVRCFCTNFYILQNNQKRLYSHFYRSGKVYDPFRAWAYREFMPRTGASIFNKDILMKYPFKEHLKRYEDADSLFDIMRNETFICSKKATMIYNCDSLSASSFRKNIEEDFLGYLSLENKSFWEKVLLTNLYLQCKQGYPLECKQLYKEEDFLSSDCITALNKCQSVIKQRELINRILNKLHIDFVL